MTAREFMLRFEQPAGAAVYAKLYEDVVFGRYMDLAANLENMEALAVAKGFEKCGIFPGINTRIAAELIIGSMK
jgi:hypothetical protein